MKKCSRCRKKAETLKIMGLNVFRDAIILIIVCKDCITDEDNIMDNKCNACGLDITFEPTPEQIEEGYTSCPSRKIDCFGFGRADCGIMRRMINA